MIKTLGGGGEWRRSELNTYTCILKVLSVNDASLVSVQEMRPVWEPHHHYVN